MGAPTDAPSDFPTYSPTAEPTSEPTTSSVENTPAPTHHSAKKWVMLHPDYKGGDGELLWNIYYGDLADDERFDAFRKDHLWDASVIRPMIEMDMKYKKFHLRNQNVNVSEGKTSAAGGYQWLIMAGL